MTESIISNFNESTPVLPGSAALDDLIAAVAADADARDRGEIGAQPAVDLLKRARFGAFRIPRAEGGGGASLVELFETVIRLAEADSNIPHIVRNHLAFVEKALRTRDNPKYRRWLDLSVEGKLFGLGASELNVQDVGRGNGATVLERRGDEYVLNGRKYYSTGNRYGDYIFVYAGTPEGEPVAAMTPVARDGVDSSDDWDGIGQRLTASGTTVFTNVRIAPDDVIHQNEEDLRLPFEATFPQIYLTAIITGVLRAVVRDAADLLRSRTRNYYHAVDPSPARDPLLQQTIGRLSGLAYVAESAVLRAVEALGRAQESAEAGRPDPELYREAGLRAAKSKIVLDELAIDAAGRLFDVGGASAARQATRLDRHWRNIRTLSSHNPVAYKARAVGAHVIDGSPLPNASFF